MSWKALAVVLLAGGTSPTMSQSFTVGEMLPACERFGDTDVRVMGIYCVGAIHGVAAIMEVNCRLREAGFEIPGGLAIDQLPTPDAKLQGFLNWARDHPEAWSFNFPAATTKALTESWPCESL